MTARLLVLLPACALATAVGAQSVSVSGATSVRYIELRPLVSDSVPASTTEGTALLRGLPDGRVVRCVPGEAYCLDLRPGSPVSTVPMVTDLDVSAWGFGEGIRLNAQLRMRHGWGSAPELWPQGGRALEALAAYAELDRERWRVRLGRQWKVTGLGFHNFDGISALARPSRALTLEGYAGRSLLRGLNEARVEGALASIEPLAPPSAGTLAGVQLRAVPAPGASLAAGYQVEFRGDGGGLLGELALANVVLPLGRATAEGGIEADVAGRQLNEATFRVRAPVARHVLVDAELRHYRPYFELWTIWGAFSPLGYDEARAGASWPLAGGALQLRAEASRRRYERDAGGDAFGGFRRSGWGMGGSARWIPSAAWTVDASGRAETGFGAGGREGQAGVARRIGDDGRIAVHALAFQRNFELRLADGTVLGAEAELALPVTTRLRVQGAAAVYRHARVRATAVDWNQRRLSLRLEWTMGTEPRIPIRPVAAP